MQKARRVERRQRPSPRRLRIASDESRGSAVPDSVSAPAWVPPWENYKGLFRQSASLLGCCDGCGPQRPATPTQAAAQRGPLQSQVDRAVNPKERRWADQGTLVNAGEGPLRLPPTLTSTSPAVEALRVPAALLAERLDRQATALLIIQRNLRLGGRPTCASLTLH